MPSVHWEPKQNGYKLRFRDFEDTQRTIWLGSISKRQAAEVLQQITTLIEDRKHGLEAQASTIRWLNEIDSKLFNKMARKGLVPPDLKRRTKCCYTLAEYMDHVETMKSDWKPRTVINHRQVRRILLEYFGKEKLLADVTPGEIDSWRRWMRSSKNFAEATSGKHVKRLKAVFQFAIDEEILERNPAGKQVVSAQVNRDRDFYITRPMADEILEKCPNVHWRLIFALCRFAGLRCPSEVLALRWSDIHWAENRMRIDSPKTGLRFCPIFAALLPTLEEAFEAADENTIFCIRGNRDASINLRSRMHTIIESAGIKPWPKLFVNLRASCRTELQNQFPDHALDSWLGHSTAVARKHYLQVTDDHWSAAATGQSVFQNASANKVENQTLQTILSAIQGMKNQNLATR